MSDDFEDLKAALKAATPQPDAGSRAANLALARKNFEQLQGTDRDKRLNSDGPKSGLWTGARKMLNYLTPRTGLTVTTALIAVAFVTLSPVRDMIVPTDPFVARPDHKVVPTAIDDEVLAEADRDMNATRTEQALVASPANEAMASRPKAAKSEIQPRTRLAAPANGHATGINNPAPAVPMQDAEQLLRLEEDTESFANEPTNPLIITAETPVSTFSIDVDTASYAVVRNSLMSGYLPDPRSIRIEEMINYFPYAYPAPEGDAPFGTTVSVSQTPWNDGTQLVHIGIQGEMPAIKDRPPLNLVFLIDTSGSMDAANKLPLLKQSFALMLGQLRDEDQIAIVTYAGSAGQALEPTAASDRKTIMAALNRLGAGGSTAGQAGLQQAYATASDMAEEGEVTRVILATDGDFNVGVSDPENLKRLISDQRDSGTYLSVLGFGRGNLDDATMQALAQNGNGQAAYIDTLAEAQKVLVDQLTGALYPIANDVKIQVEFNPTTVAEYRLIGYETRALRREDFNNDKVDAGDIGAGHSVTALYEITPVGSPARLSDPLRYQAAPTTDTSGELGFLRLRYKLPGEADSDLIEQVISVDLPPQPGSGFAAAIAGFGQLLLDGVHLGDWGYDQAIALANANKGDDTFGYRTEAVQLMRLAQSLSAQ